MSHLFRLTLKVILIALLLSNSSFASENDCNHLLNNVILNDQNSLILRLKKKIEFLERDFPRENKFRADQLQNYRPEIRAEYTKSSDEKIKLQLFEYLKEVNAKINKIRVVNFLPLRDESIPPEFEILSVALYENSASSTITISLVKKMREYFIDKYMEAVAQADQFRFLDLIDIFSGRLKMELTTREISEEELSPTGGYVSQLLDTKLSLFFNEIDINEATKREFLGLKSLKKMLIANFNKSSNLNKRKEIVKTLAHIEKRIETIESLNIL